MDFLTDPVFAGFLAASVRLAIPILLAALGGIFAERAGVLNIGLEGQMLTGALAGYAGATLTQNLWFGVIIAMVAGAMAALVLAYYAIRLRANQVIVGIALNLGLMGATSFAYRLLFGVDTPRQRVDSFQSLNLGALADIPVLGPLLFRLDALSYLALAAVFVSWFVLARLRIGLNLRAAGEHPEAAKTLGLNVPRIRFGAMAVAGALAGVGGASLSLAATGTFVDNMTAGRGYIALAILILGQRHPIGALASALLFGAAEALQLRAQLLPINIPVQFLQMLPYVLTIAVLAGLVGRSRAPAALGKPLSDD
ncbi:simple sugar transport system permease protein (plasmid) [Ketogulonicigenium robustum]|uniref:Simple sugar transport system permease protein n=1 Tax=Ketogulonicigenium robustum TaxID=92947 RepID=A0A1W6P2S1_9RHOB|nr:ABC transporter permease [Ketogulonicigenium robustum]ARO15818.1 simple sugar transport system permease protein [Ketogulonicigenium robustum]